jgi:hypothetical protein
VSPRRGPAAARALSRRRFVTMLAAGTAALAASPALAAKAATAPAKKPATPPASKSAASAAALQKEFDRQRAGTLDTVKTLREFPLLPGGDLPVVFRPLRPVRKER